jgi:hypothetical protein
MPGSGPAVVALVTLLLPRLLPAMDLPHYDTDSLAYLSTDIVITNLSVDAQKRMTASVTEVLFGGLKPGDALDNLSLFLTFFLPMDDGQHMILFLDRRPRKPGLFDPGSSKSPFAVVPSGVYLIDEYGHVHEYYQESNPGLYAAQGYRFFLQKVVPTKEQSLALPSLAEVRQRIAASLKYVEPLRPLLDKDPAAEDAPELLNLLDASVKRRKSCGSDAIIERLGEQLRSLNDPEIALEAFSLSPDWRDPLAFVLNSAGNRVDFTATRLKYLLQTISDRKREIGLRVAALDILFSIKGASSSPSTDGSLTIEDWLRVFAGQIHAVAASILDDDSEDVRLRSRSLQFMDLGYPDILADVKTVYGRTASEELRFAIEDLFLDKSDASYGSLNPPGGPIAGIILVAPPQGCIKPHGDNVAFIVKCHFRQDQIQTIGQPGVTQSGSPGGILQIVLTDVRNGKRFTPKVTFVSGSVTSFTGQYGFELTQPMEVPAGEYYLSAEFGRGGQVFSTSRRQLIEITEATDGRRVAVK